MLRRDIPARERAATWPRLITLGGVDWGHAAPPRPFGRGGMSTPASRRRTRQCASVAGSDCRVAGGRRVVR